MFAEFGAFESYLRHDLLLQRAWPPDLEARTEHDFRISIFRFNFSIADEVCNQCNWP